MAVRAHCMVTTYDPQTNTVLTSATVNVYNPGTVTPISATIFDKSGNPLSNPLTSDATTGLVDFYLNVAQEVDLVVSKSSFTTRTYSNVPVLDDSSLELTALLTTTGDMVYASSNNSPARLAIGSTGNVIYVNGGVPTYNANFNITAAGNVGIGNAASGNQGLTVSTALVLGSAAAQSYSIVAQGVGPSASTTEIAGVFSAPQTSATSFTCTTVASFHAAAPVKGSGSTITNAYGLLVDSVTAGGSANYGIFVNAPSGATVNAGLAAFGDILVGATSGSPNATNATTGFLWLPTCAGTPTGVPAMNATGSFSGHLPLTYDNSNKKLWVYDGGWKGVVLS